ncbi:MAG: YbaB/EbfC family nucleoid-associated protein [Bacilli bacterium]|nr:YbaB/EbfC family nucleoid-associated protein [Bacilli bacterium]
MNMQNLMAQANKIKRDVEKKQNEIDNMTFEGNSQFVNVRMSGKREVKNLKINNYILKDAEDLEILEDMIVLAFNDALLKIDKKTEEELGAYTGGLNGLF